MKKTLIIFIFFVCTGGFFPVQAGKYTDTLSTCMIEKTTAEEQKNMGRWMFSVLSAHPDMQQFFSYTHNKDLQQQLDKKLATLMGDLLLNRCKHPLQNAIRQEGLNSIKNAGQQWAKIAVTGLSNHPDVKQQLSAYLQYINILKLFK